MFSSAIDWLAPSLNVAKFCVTMAASVPPVVPVDLEVQADYGEDDEVCNEVAIERSRDTDANPGIQQVPANPNPVHQQASANSSTVADSISTTVSSATADSTALADSTANANPSATTDDSIPKENAVDANPAKVQRLGQEESLYDWDWLNNHSHENWQQARNMVARNMDGQQQSPGGGSWQQRSWHSWENQTWLPRSWDKWTWSKREQRREERRASRTARWNNVDEESTSASSTSAFSSSNVPTSVGPWVERRWSENVGTKTNPKLRQVCYGLFVYSETRSQWVPHSKAESGKPPDDVPAALTTLSEA